ncbi:MAG: hypothetical protein JWO97_1899 [Acidobacteria bacterium]|nr:hypothetical protein [Acidobacteriota bacterium]
MKWLIYGANGYTGELIAREAVKRGETPILAGRSAEKIAPLARELGLESRAFALDKPQLDGVSLVLHCAGPFVQTSAPMVRACLDAGVHYLDITGEISVFEAIFALDDEARRRNVMLVPGVGFDVVPTDCLAAQLAAQMPDATELVLAFHPKGGELSRGTMKTMIESIGEGGAIRRNGRIVRVPVAFDARDIPFSGGTKSTMTIPWGDVSTAFHSTGIPNIRVYLATPRKAIARARRMRAFLPLLSPKPIRRLLQKFADRRSGPDAAKRASGRVYLWGEVSNGSETRSMTLETPEGYAFTAVAAVSAVKRVLGAPRGGAFTPSSAFGMNFVNEIPLPPGEGGA